MTLSMDATLSDVRSIVGKHLKMNMSNFKFYRFGDLEKRTKENSRNKNKLYHMRRFEENEDVYLYSKLENSPDSFPFLLDDTA
jgi:hypothetical protein